MGNKDLEMICVNCGKKFIFSVGEQAFFEENGLRFPKRCKECREKKKKKRPKRVPTIIGQKNTVKTHAQNNVSSEKTVNSVTKSTETLSGKKCGDCSIGNTDKCSNPMHHNDDNACELFISKKILTKEMIDSFPTQGRATYLKYGKAGKSQFKRSKHESE